MPAGVLALLPKACGRMAGISLQSNAELLLSASGWMVGGEFCGMLGYGWLEVMEKMSFAVLKAIL